MSVAFHVCGTLTFSHFPFHHVAPVWGSSGNGPRLNSQSLLKFFTSRPCAAAASASDATNSIVLIDMILFLSVMNDFSDQGITVFYFRATGVNREPDNVRLR